MTIAAADGVPLAATEFGNDGPVVLVAPATGVKRFIYAAFAAHLAGAGFTVVTWDWRGIGGSRRGSLRGFQATMRDWGERDMGGVIAWARERYPGVPLTAVGHSFGGQALGLAPNGGEVRAIVLVAAQSGYYGHWPPAKRPGYWLLWHIAFPALTTVFGYFPAALLGIGEDLPAGVARQWASWCRNPDYLGDWSGHGRVRAPLLSLSFDDDPYATERAADVLYGHFGSAVRRRRHLRAAEAGMSRVGHFGFFRPEAARLWDEVTAWLRTHAA